MGTRLGALTAKVPKPMLPIGGEPLLAHTLRYLRGEGVDWVAINLHFLPDVIQGHFGAGEGFGLQIHYSREDRLLGTAGTLRSLMPVLAGEDEIVALYGDLLIDQSLAPLLQRHRNARADATLLVHQRAGSNSLLRMADDGLITGFVERPSDEEREANPFPWVNSGLAVIGPRVLDAIPERAPADLPRDVYIPGLQRLRLYGVPLTGYRCAIDSPDRYSRAQEAFRSGAYRHTQ